MASCVVLSFDPVVCVWDVLTALPRNQRVKTMMSKYLVLICGTLVVTQVGGFTFPGDWHKIRWVCQWRQEKHFFLVQGKWWRPEWWNRSPIVRWWDVVSISGQLITFTHQMGEDDGLLTRGSFGPVMFEVRKKIMWKSVETTIVLPTAN